MTNFFFFSSRWLSKPGIPVELQLMSLGSLKLLIYVDDTFTSQGFYCSITAKSFMILIVIMIRVV